MHAIQTVNNGTAAATRIAYALLVVAVTTHIAVAAKGAGFGVVGIALSAAACLCLIAVPWVPEIALAAFACAAYGSFRYSAQFDTVLTLQLPTWIAVIGFVGWTISLTGDRRKPRIDHWLVVTMCAFSFWIAASMVASWTRGNPMEFSKWNHPAQFLQATLLFIVAINTLREKFTAWGFALVISCLPLIQALQRLGRGFYLDNDLPLLSAIVFPFAALGVAAAPHWVLRAAFALPAAGLLGIIAAAQNRGAAVALVGAALALWWNSRCRLRWLLAGLPAIVLAAWLFVPQGHFERFRALWDQQSGHPTAGRDRATAQGRLTLWDGAIDMLSDHPIVGVGPGNFARETGLYLRKKTRLPAHNSILHMAAETGIPGALLYLTLFIGAVIVLQRRLRDPQSDWHAPLARSVLAALIAYLVGGLFMSRHDMQLAYILLGWAVVLQFQAQERGHLSTG
jgi:hypothetical protein